MTVNGPLFSDREERTSRNDADFVGKRSSLARGSDAGVKHQTQGWARTAQVAMPGEASGDARLAKITPGRNAAFGRRQQNSHSGFAWPAYHFMGMRRREEPGLRSRARLDR
ncbi:hypothetical protein RJ60_09580 [Mesotoga sp. B105.6.4]|nr:hypothetical protein RM69_06675 [Mesotoga sp. SC_NapDC3]PNS38771.1 hypothetical protein RJ60_09580 [Mesotoga sp. B105.6.4]PXF34159.1 hypothetical protein EU77_09375 [Mesotoga sp. SC_NapDC]